MSEEVRGQVPGTICNGACSKSANIQTPGLDVHLDEHPERPREWRSASAYCRHQAEVPATQYGASRWRHMLFYYLLSRYTSIIS